MSESSSLHIHTRAVPNGAQTALDGAGGPSAEEGAGAAVPGRVRGVLRRHSRRISRGDALLRNGTIACALLLGILALGRLEAPWAKVASERIEQALTLRIDLKGRDLPQGTEAVMTIKKRVKDEAIILQKRCDASEEVVTIALEASETELAPGMYVWDVRLRIPREDVAHIAAAHPGRLVVIDEAYVDFDTKTCAKMVREHRNLIVVQTMSKSRNLAGAHIGYAFAQPDLVFDMRDIKFSFNPFNVSAPTMAIGIAALQDEEFFRAYTQSVCDERDATQEALRAMGFTVTTSHTNFVFATHPQLTAEDWQARLREEGILTRRFAGPRTGNWLRVSVGTHDEMQAFLQQTRRILDSQAS